MKSTGINWIIIVCYIFVHSVIICKILKTQTTTSTSLYSYDIYL